MTEACAAIVARDDSHLHATALFAPEPGRSRLMVLYAFDIELSRAAVASSEALIARMRLQWWRDVVEGARTGTEPPAHEVAGPFAGLLRESDLPGDMVEALIAAREAELDAALGGGFGEAAFARWADDRFGALTALAAKLLTEDDGPSVEVARRAGPVLGTAYAIRHAAAIAEGAAPSLLPELTPGERAELAEGESAARGAEPVRRRARDALDRLAVLRAERGRIDGRAVPALLPLRRAERVLARASRPGVALGELGPVDRPFEGLRLALAAATGRW